MQKDILIHLEINASRVTIPWPWARNSNIFVTELRVPKAHPWSTMGKKIW